MSEEARANGWRGFDGIGEKVGGWLYRCDGMPWPAGCGAEMVSPVRLKKVGKKKSGWLVCYGLEPKTPATRFDDPDGFEEDHDIVLTFCPECTVVVEAQYAKTNVQTPVQKKEST